MPTTPRKSAPSAALRTPVRIDIGTQANVQRGGYDLDWTPLFSARAERIDLSGGEQLRAAQVTNTYMIRYRLRWPPSVSVDASMRLVDLTDNRTYNVRSIDGPDQLYRWVTLQCEYIPGSSGG